MSVEDDVARLNAVTAALVGPRCVWMLQNDDGNETYVHLFSSEHVAREHWFNFVRSDATSHSTYYTIEQFRRMIFDDKVTMLLASHENHYSLTLETVTNE